MLGDGNMKNPVICFIGLDGSGKSTCVDGAYDYLARKRIKVKKVRAAYVVKFFNLPIKLAKRIILGKNSNPFNGDYKTYLENMRKKGEGKSFYYRAFNALTKFEFNLQIFFSIKLNSLLGYTLLVDRYIYDNAVTYAANLGLGQDFLRETIEKKWKNAPKPDIIFYIKTPIETCLERKDDIPDPLYLEVRKPLYDAIAEMYGATVISGAQPLEDMRAEVFDYIEREF